MQPKELEQLLRKWGRWFGGGDGQHLIDGWAEPTSLGLGGRSLALLQQLRVGKGAQPKSMRERLAELKFLRDADGNLVLDERGRKILDREAMEKHRCFGAETRSMYERQWHPDPEAERVDRLCCELHRHNPVQGVVLRVEYCYPGHHRAHKLPYAQRALENPKLNMRRYRHELDLARAWMHGALIAA